MIRLKLQPSKFAKKSAKLAHLGGNSICNNSNIPPSIIEYTAAGIYGLRCKFLILSNKTIVHKQAYMII